MARTRGRHEAPDDPRPGERLVRAGAAVFAVGVVGVLLAVVPFFFGRQDAPSWTALTASLLPVGLGIALVGLLLGARSRRRTRSRARRSSTRTGTPGR